MLLYQFLSKDFIRNMVAKFLSGWGIKMSIPLKHLQGAMSHGHSEFQIRGSLAGCKCTKCMSHVMGTAMHLKRAAGIYRLPMGL
jgi:hypothetical protein